MPPKRDIVYPIFLECCQYADDNFWENVFEDLAYGKCPSGTYMNKNFFCCSYKNKEFSYKVERKDPHEIYDEIYGLLTEKLGILSVKEKAKKKILFNELEQNIKDSRQEWNSIRKKNIKDVLYEKFVIDMKKKYDLSAKQCKFLLGILMLSILFKTISSKDIVYKDDKIISIEGFVFEKNKVSFNRKVFSETSENVNDDVSENTNALFPYWEKHLKSIKTYSKICSI